MAGVTVADPSIYNNVWKPDPMSGVDLQKKYLDIQQARQQNRLTQQELQFREGVAEAEAASTNPDGTQDTGRFNKLIMSNPRTAFKAQEMLLQGNQLNSPTPYAGTDEKGNIVQKSIPAQHFRGLEGNPEAVQSQPNTDSEEDPALSQLHSRVGALQSATEELLNNPNPSRQAAIGVFSGLISDKHLSPQEAVQIMSDPSDPLPEDTTKIKAWAQRHALQLGEQKQLLDAHAPMRRAPSLTTGPAFTQGMRPVNNLDDVLNNEQVSPSTRNRHTGSPGVGTAAPVGYAQDIEANVARAQELEKSAQNFPARKALLGNLEALNKQFVSGPYSKEISLAKKASNQVLGTNFGEDKIKAQEEFGKNAFQLAQQQFQALGGTGTDSKLGSAMSTSPSELLSQQGNEGIIHLLKGNEDALKVMNNEWQEYKQLHGVGSYGTFVTEFNNHYDPRVFQAKYMTKEEKKQMIKGMSDQERQVFFSNYDSAHDRGWVN